MIPVYRFRVQRSGLKNTKPTHIKLGMNLFVILEKFNAFRGRFYDENTFVIAGQISGCHEKAQTVG